MGGEDYSSRNIIHQVSDRVRRRTSVKAATAQNVEKLKGVNTYATCPLFRCHSLLKRTTNRLIFKTVHYYYAFSQCKNGNMASLQ